MSTTERGDFWKHEINAPYTKQSFLQNPEPGHYATNANKKKENEVKNRILME